ncbi:alpha/beta hydrolase [Nocardiopsis sp. RSe5-2]|uniref:Alpha/beta hydrolase n=1 Tax=Nocardiopsis endophytica TaxID=3018445 RepID=A0ABT4TZK1_9ACTN|nr:alpha/beta hydrolase [Nocardiopsis endophytica]MDA2809532.1 alpha/beta hydrolase [Nocardiopsis endophytica]
MTHTETAVSPAAEPAPGPVAGTAAGVPFLAVPPAIGGPRAPLVLALHAFEPPRGETALAGTLPMASLPAWRVYLGLPMFGARLPEGGVAAVNELGRADYLLHLYAPVVEQAGNELHAAAAELAARFPVVDGPVGLMGVGAGGAAAMLALAESDLPVAAVGLVNPVTAPQRVIAARERRTGAPYVWTEEARDAAVRLDVAGRVSDMAARRQVPPVLVVSGGQDEVVPPDHGRGLCSALAPYTGPERVRHAVVPDLAHTLGPEPGLQPGPPTPGGVLADRALTEWFHRHLSEQ